MRELIFVVEEADEGGLVARALGESIFAEADDMVTLKGEIIDAVNCHFEDAEKPKMVVLHYVREELLAI